MARKSSKLELTNVNVKVKPENLYFENVPVNYYAEKGAEAVEYHVNIRFADYEDLVRAAIGKVKHTVGHAIREKKINHPSNEESAGITTVDSTGYPPLSFADIQKKLDPAVQSVSTDKDKAELKAYLENLLKNIK